MAQTLRGRMYLRQHCKALRPKDVRELIDAEHFAEGQGFRLNTTITIHPKLLTAYPADVGHWVVGILNKLRILCTRDRRIGYYALWVRENYDGDRREHLHVMLYVPERGGHRAALEEALSRWLPGADGVFKIGRPEYRTDRFGRQVNKGLTYFLKQMDNQARFALCNRVRREAKCQETHARVAAVLGKRCGTSRSLNRAAREAFAGNVPNSLEARLFRSRSGRAAA